MLAIPLHFLLMCCLCSYVYGHWIMCMPFLTLQEKRIYIDSDVSRSHVVKTVTSVYIHSSEKSCFVQKGRMVPICLRCLNCTKFGLLILWKTIKIVATRGQILRLKCTKFDFGWGSAPDPAGGDYRAPQTS